MPGTGIHSQLPMAGEAIRPQRPTATDVFIIQCTLQYFQNTYSRSHCFHLSTKNFLPSFFVFLTENGGSNRDPKLFKMQRLSVGGVTSPDWYIYGRTPIPKAQEHCRKGNGLIVKARESGMQCLVDITGQLHSLNHNNMAT